MKDKTARCTPWRVFQTCCSRQERPRWKSVCDRAARFSAAAAAVAAAKKRNSCSRVTPALGPSHTVSKSHDSVSKDFVTSFASRLHWCFGSGTRWFCIKHVVGNVTMSTGIFLELWRRYLLSWCYLAPCQFVFWTHWGDDCQTLRAQDKLAPVDVENELVMNPGNWKLAGPSCVSENTLPNTFLYFCFLAHPCFSRRIDHDRREQEKESGVLQFSVHLVGCWRCQNHAPRDRFGTAVRRRYERLRKIIQESPDSESSDGNHGWPDDATSSDSWDFASPDAQIAMETSIIGCRIARFGFGVTTLLEVTEEGPVVRNVSSRSEASCCNGGRNTFFFQTVCPLLFPWTGSAVLGNCYPGQKNWDSRASQTTGVLTLEIARACAPVRAVILIFMARVGTL